MDTVNKGINDLFRIIITVFIIAVVGYLFVYLLPVVLVIVAGFWFYRFVKRKVNERKMKKGNIEFTDKVVDNEEQFDFAESEVIDVDYKDIK